MPFATAVSQSIAGWFLGTPMANPPAGLLIALSCADPLSDGSGLSEPPGASGYARQPVTVATAVQPDGSVEIISTAPLVFGPVTNAAWPTVVYGALFAADGRFLAKGTLGVQRSAPIGDTVSFGIGAFAFKIG